MLRNLVEGEARFHRVRSYEKLVGSEAASGFIVQFNVSAVLSEQVVGEPNKLRDGFPGRAPSCQQSAV